MRRRSVQIDSRLDNKIERSAVEAARRKFSLEFMNRMDKVVIFRTLRAEELEQILEIELGMLQQRILQSPKSKQFMFSCTRPLKQFLLRDGVDMKYGARHLRRAIERHIVFPLADLVATGQLHPGDFVCVDFGRTSEVTFVEQAEEVSVPALLAA